VRRGLKDRSYFFREFLDPKRFRHMRQVIAVQKIARVRSENVSGDEEEPIAKRILGAGESLVEMLAIELGHFHIANSQRVVFVGGAVERFAGVEEDVNAQALVLKHIRD
jgi:hypothetical protein